MEGLFQILAAAALGLFFSLLSWMKYPEPSLGLLEKGVLISHLWILGTAYFLFGATWFRKRVAASNTFSRRALSVFTLLALGSYAQCAALIDSYTWTGLLALSFYVAFSAALWGSLSTGRKFGFRDVLVASSTVIPIMFNWPTHIWPTPAGSYRVFEMFFSVSWIVVLADSSGRIPNLGYEYRSEPDGWKHVARNYIFFVPLAIAIGIVTGFIEPQMPDTGILDGLLLVVATFLLVAIPEEVVFRGIIQNLLVKSSRSPLLATWISAAIFGASHLHHGASPDWRYGLLATLAGFFYGRVYIKTGNLIYAALLHMLVDLSWSLFFKTSMI